MQKGLENIIKQEVTVNPDTAIRAAKEIAAIEAQQNKEDTDIAAVMVQMDEVIRAVREETDPDAWERIRARLSGEPVPARHANYDAIEAEVDDTPGYDPDDPDLEDLEAEDGY